MCVALPIVGAWSMAVLLWQLFEYYYYYLYCFVFSFVAIVFNVSLQMDSVPESAGSATVIISPSSAVPEAVTLTIQTMGGSATGI